MSAIRGEARSRASAARRRASALALVLVCTAAACGGDSSADDAGGSDAPPTAADAGATVIPSTTKVLDEQTLAVLSSVSDDRTELSFSAATDQLRALEVDDILVASPAGAAPDGLLRRVVRVDVGASGVAVQTSFASLEDAIQEGQMNFEQELGIDDIDLEELLHEGIEPLGSDDTSSNAIYAAAGGKLGVYINDTIMPGVRVTGSVELAVTPTFSASWSGASIGKLTAKLTASESASLRVVGAYELSGTKEKRVYRVKFTPKVVFVGVVPVVLRPVLEVYVGAQAAATANFTTGASQQLDFTGGLQYEKGTGWSPINQFTKIYSYESPSLNGDFNAKAYARARLSLNLYGVAGPYVGASGHVRVEAKALQPDPWCELFVGVSAVAGIAGEIAGVSLGEVERDLFSVEESLFQCRRPFLVVDDTSDLWTSGVEGGPAFAPGSSAYSLSAKEDSTGNLAWTAAADVDWLEVSPASGTADTSSSQAVTVTVTDAANSLAVGRHTGTVSFTNTTNGQGDTTRRVQLNVRQQSMTVEPGPDSHLLGPRPEGDDFAGVTYAFTLSSDAGTIDFAITDDVDWLTLSLESGNVTEGTPVIVTATVDGLAAAELPARAHRATIAFENVTTGKGSTTRTVYLQPIMRVTGTDKLDATVLGSAGLTGKVETSYTVAAVNADILWTATTTVPWIHLAPWSGSVAAGETITVTATIDQAAVGDLPTGSYEPAITFTNQDSGPLSDQTIQPTRLRVARNAFDPTFDSDGMALDGTGGVNRGYAVALEAAGAILIAGDRSYGPATWKLTTAGALDPTFGTGGITTAGGIERVDIAVANSALITTGTTDDDSTDDILVWRQLPGGALDIAFGSAGVATFDSGFRDAASAVAVDGSGRIYVAGVADWNLLLVRLLSTGAVDSSFGTGGMATYDGDLGYDGAADMAMDADGSILLVGETAGATDADMILLRYTADGALSGSFGASGRVVSELGGDDYGAALAIDSAGRIVVAGSSVPTGSLYRQLTVWRFTSDGMRDDSFGVSGVAHYADVQYSEASAVAIDAGGNIIVGGMLQEAASPQRLGIWRFTPSGAVDTNFGTGGLASWLSNESTVGRDLALDDAGRIVVVGWHGTALAAWRFVP